MSEDWHEYFKQIRLEREAYAAGDGNTEKHDTVILVPGRLAMGAEIVNPAKRLIKTLDANGWEYRVGYAKSSKVGDVFKTGQRAGERRDDKITESCWVDAIHRGRRKRFTARWYTVGGKTTLDSISYDSALIKSTELTALVRGDDDDLLVVG